MLTPGRDICQEANLRHTWAKSVVSATSTRDGLKETKKVSADPPYELPMLITPPRPEACYTQHCAEVQPKQPYDEERLARTSCSTLVARNEKQTWHSPE